ncbi:hypothetical protein Poly24_41590 [Rosistilla carotiformis]|uniref:Carboxypeptidase regulatory-like domain-containing protein n=1 Tax=Rosistilla carotiformis TaxID=2528017 RepID=A0A518JY22_9BACT|nr:carboxypeptidase-like regulatory domain-containing protein [Rosistilla carotiformis]QDV70435.1 hypothetical protein Poly24_41590 [Rosistilla carotiformis]
MKQFVCLLVLVPAGFLTGCSQPASVNGVVPVTGTILHKGQPVAGATVTFVPNLEGRACSGATDENGHFEVTTLQPGDGAIPGRYNVLVAKSEVEGALSEDEALEYMKKHGKEPTITVKDLLPIKYKRRSSSDLMAEVGEGEENDFTFDLID